MAGTQGRSGRKPKRLQQFGAVHNTGPTIPAGIDTATAAKWKALVDEIPRGTLCRVDVHLLLTLCRLLVMADLLQVTIAKNPLDDRSRRLQLQVADRISRFSAMFGLSPADRQRMKLVDTGNKGDDFDKWKEST